MSGEDPKKTTDVKTGEASKQKPGLFHTFARVGDKVNSGEVSPRSANRTLVVIFILVLVLVFGGGYWWFRQQSQEDQQSPLKAPTVIDYTDNHLKLLEEGRMAIRQADTETIDRVIGEIEKLPYADTNLDLLYLRTVSAHFKGQEEERQRHLDKLRELTQQGAEDVPQTVYGISADTLEGFEMSLENQGGAAGE